MLKAAVVCSNPWNLETGSHALQRSWIGLHVYSRVMGGNMKKLFEKLVLLLAHTWVKSLTCIRHIEQISQNPRVDVERVRKVIYLHEFDRYEPIFYSHAYLRNANFYDRELQGPTWGYPTEGAYYRDASSADSVLAVKVPLLAINAEDDPVCSSALYSPVLPYLTSIQDCRQ